MFGSWKHFACNSTAFFNLPLIDNGELTFFEWEGENWINHRREIWNGSDFLGVERNQTSSSSKQSTSQDTRRQNLLQQLILLRRIHENTTQYSAKAEIVARSFHYHLSTLRWPWGLQIPKLVNYSFRSALSALTRATSPSSSTKRVIRKDSRHSLTISHRCVLRYSQITKMFPGFLFFLTKISRLPTIQTITQWSLKKYNIFNEKYCWLLRHDAPY